MATLATSSSPPSTPSSSSSSSSSCPQWKYDVFLSFCGIDTRKNFTDHVYTALKRKGITTFRDDEKLERGKYISEELLKAIGESKYAIIVLSTNYASSKWCLTELAKIVECMKNNKLTVLPVFYHVEPSDVRNQMSDNLVKDFAEHVEKTKVKTEDVQAWKAALKDVGGIAGWHVHDRYESKVIQEIIGKICTELYHKFSSVCEEPVGMDSCVEEMLGSYLGEGLGGVRFVGICGMGGIGKTTLAQEIYRRISKNFYASSFIANVREETENKGLVSLQGQLLSKILMESKIEIWNVDEGINVIRNALHNKKVFIVLDDVDGEQQLEVLAGKHDWFGAGSRIIVTSRDSHLLIKWGVNVIYTAKELSDNDALKLFSLKAFHKPHPEENFVDLSKDFVNYAKGLPLALKVLGSSLFAKRTNEWKGFLDKLKEEPDRKILDILQISFHGLTDSQKGLFLDIACFFKGEKKDCISDILESFGYHPKYNIGVLKEKSLIAIDYDGMLWMHDLLQDMGQQIVFHESPNEPGGRSRLWHYEDVLLTLKNNTGTAAVKGIKLNTPNQKEESLSAKAFTKMTKLRFLKIFNVQLPKGLSYLSNELRFIEWYRYPLKSMPTSFQPNKLVELRMRCSRIKHLWKRIMDLDELRLIDLSDSHNLIEMPDLSGAPKLKQLILQRCIKLYKIHASLENLKCLIRLDLNGCKCLKSLPENLGNIECLEELDVSETAIIELPSSFVLLKNLKVLSLHSCKGLSSISSNKFIRFPLIQKRGVDPTDILGRTLSNLWSLTRLNLRYCNLQVIPDSLGCLSSLEYLDLKGNNFVCLPESTTQLSNMRHLSLCGCTHLRSLPELPSNIEYIDADGCASLEILPLRPEDGPYQVLCLLGCDKLINNEDYDDMLLANLRHHIIKGNSYYYITIPGREIPKWFEHRSVGSSVNLQVPSDKLKGIAVCAVFVLRHHHPLHQLLSDAEIFDGYIITHRLGWSLKANGVRCHQSFTPFPFSEQFGKIESYHLHLDCDFNRFDTLKMTENWIQDANGFVQIEIGFETEGPGLEVTKCGAHLILEQDIEDLNQTMLGCSSSSRCSITPYEDYLEDSAKDTKTK